MYYKDVCNNVNNQIVSVGKIIMRLAKLQFALCTSVGILLHFLDRFIITSILPFIETIVIESLYIGKIANRPRIL